MHSWPLYRMINRSIRRHAGGGRCLPGEIDRSACAGPLKYPTGLETTQPWNARPSRNRWNLSLIEDYYERWRKDPTSVEESWRIFFEGYELGREPRGSGRPKASTSTRRGPGGRHPADRRLPRVRPLPGRPRPAQAQPATRVARTARAGGVRPDRSRPGPGLLQPAERHGAGASTLRELIADPAGDLLPHDRRRVHAHPRHRRSASGCWSGWSRSGTGPAFDIKQEAADHLQAERGRAVRDVPPQELRGPEAVLARRGRDADPAPGRDHRAGRVAAGSGRSSWACRTAAGSTCWRTSSTSRTG